jgi:hypothetical protein
MTDGGDPVGYRASRRVFGGLVLGGLAAAVIACIASGTFQAMIASGWRWWLSFAEGALPW